MKKNSSSNTKVIDIDLNVNNLTKVFNEYVLPALENGEVKRDSKRILFTVDDVTYRMDIFKFEACYRLSFEYIFENNIPKLKVSIESFNEEEINAYYEENQKEIMKYKNENIIIEFVNVSERLKKEIKTMSKTVQYN